MCTKRCTKCKEIKFLSYFPKRKERPCGYSSWCKSCISKSGHKYYLRNKEKIRRQAKIYNKIHVEERSIYDRKYQQKHRKKLTCYQRTYLKKHRKIPRIKLRHSLTERMRKVLKGITKSDTTMKLVGCSIKFLKGYLEKQFTKRMNWDNYGVGGWEIDHIEPCKSFDLRKESEQKNCFHYTNLQPLWAKDNRVKGSKIKE